MEAAMRLIFTLAATFFLFHAAAAQAEGNRAVTGSSDRNPYIGPAIEIGTSLVTPRGIPTLTTPLTTGNPQDINNGIQGIYRSGSCGTTNVNECRQLQQLDR
jgi:hypothetical protein